MMSLLVWLPGPTFLWGGGSSVPGSMSLEGGSLSRRVSVQWGGGSLSRGSLGNPPPESEAGSTHPTGMLSSFRASGLETFSNAKILLQIDLGPADQNSYAIKVEGSLKVLGTHTDIVQFTVSALRDRQCKAIDTHTGQTVSISKRHTVVQLFENVIKYSTLFDL